MRYFRNTVLGVIVQIALLLCFFTVITAQEPTHSDPDHRIRLIDSRR